VPVDVRNPDKSGLEPDEKYRVAAPRVTYIWLRRVSCDSVRRSWKKQCPENKVWPFQPTGPAQFRFQRSSRPKASKNRLCGLRSPTRERPRKIRRGLPPSSNRPKTLSSAKAWRGSSLVGTKARVRLQRRGNARSTSVSDHTG
jgi:hypothetical protein